MHPSLKKARLITSKFSVVENASIFYKHNTFEQQSQAFGMDEEEKIEIKHYTKWDKVLCFMIELFPIISILCVALVFSLYDYYWHSTDSHKKQ